MPVKSVRPTPVEVPSLGGVWGDIAEDVLVGEVGRSVAEPAGKAVPIEPAVTAPSNGRMAREIGPVLRRARPSDVGAMVELLEGYARQGLVLPRTPEQVIRHFREFVVVDDGRGLVGCAGLRVYSAELAEVCALAVDERCHGLGVGRRMVEALIAEARMLELRRVFALTLQEGFFLRLGFHPIPLESIPEKMAADRAEGIDRKRHPKVTVLLEINR